MDYIVIIIIILAFLLVKSNLILLAIFIKYFRVNKEVHTLSKECLGIIQGIERTISIQSPIRRTPPQEENIKEIIKLT